MQNLVRRLFADRNWLEKMLKFLPADDLFPDMAILWSLINSTVGTDFIVCVLNFSNWRIIDQFYLYIEKWEINAEYFYGVEGW